MHSEEKQVFLNEEIQYLLVLDMTFSIIFWDYRKHKFRSHLFF